MRILYVHAAGFAEAIGGIQTYSRKVIEGIGARGHTVEALHVIPEEVLESLMPRDRVPTPRYWSRVFFWRNVYYHDYRYHQAVQRRVAQAVRSFRPDLIHAFHVHQLGALTHRRVPAVVTCHGLEIIDHPLVRRSLIAARGVHCNSRFTQTLVEKVIGPAPKIGVATWGLCDLRPRIDDPTGFDLVTVSRLVPRKNIASIIRAVHALPGVRYGVVGDGPELEPLRKLAEELGAGNVVFTGRVSDAERQRLLATSRLFVMCPRTDLPGDVEGLGLVYFEAHAAGVPVLASRAGGVPEAVGDAGVFVDDPLNTDQLRHAIQAALDPAIYARLLERVRLRQQERPWDRFMQEIECLYQRALTAGR